MALTNTHFSEKKMILKWFLVDWWVSSIYFWSGTFYLCDPFLLISLHKKWSFPLKISSAKVPADLAAFTGIWPHLLKKSLMKTSFFCEFYVKTAASGFDMTSIRTQIILRHSLTWIHRKSHPPPSPRQNIVNDLVNDTREYNQKQNIWFPTAQD